MVEEIIGMLLLFFMMVIQVIIPPIPAEVVVIGSAKAFGVALTTLVAGAGLWVGSILAYFFGRYAQSKAQRFFKKDKVQIILKKLRKYDSAILWIRLLPYNPSDLISYAAGVAKFDQKKFMIITFFTSFIRCFLLSVLGSFLSSAQSFVSVGIVLLISATVAYSLIFRK